MSNNTFRKSLEGQSWEGLKEAVQLLMRKVLPSHCAVDSEALDMMANCVVELGSTLACETINLTSGNLEKIVKGQTLVQALDDLGYDNYVTPTQDYLHKRIQHSQTCFSCSSPNLDIVDVAVLNKNVKSKQPENVQTPATKVKRTRGKNKKVKETASKPEETKAIENVGTSSNGEGKPGDESANPKQPPAKKPKRMNWSDPKQIDNFVQMMTESLQSGKSHYEVVKEASRTLGMSQADVTSRFKALVPGLLQSSKPFQPPSSSSIGSKLLTNGGLLPKPAIVTPSISGLGNNNNNNNKVTFAEDGVRAVSSSSSSLAIVNNISVDSNPLLAATKNVADSSHSDSRLPPI